MRPNCNRPSGDPSTPLLTLTRSERTIASRMLAERVEDWQHVVRETPDWLEARERLTRLDCARIGAGLGKLVVLPAEHSWAGTVEMLADAFADAVADDPMAPDGPVLAELYARAARAG